MTDIQIKFAEIQEILERQEDNMRSFAHHKAPHIVYERLLYIFVDIMKQDGGIPQDNPDAMEILNSLNCLERYFPNCKIND